MKSCDGPCEQGRRECPTPWACEVEEPDNSSYRAVFIDCFIAAVIIAAITAIVLGVAG